MDAPTPALPPWFAEHEADDRSSHGHRQLVGYLGLFLPLALYVVAAFRAMPNLEHRRPLQSVSAYYYTGASAIFVGVLAALAVCLLTYRGFGRPWPDRVLAGVAGVAAVGVAVFPTAPPVPALRLGWWVSANDGLHFASAALLLSMFAVFSLWLFRLGKRGEARSADKKRRDMIHLVCGLVIVASLGAAAALGSAGRSIFWPEVVALEAFALSWLVKGRATHTLGAAAGRARYYATNPRQLPAALAEWRP